jgi:hypothetical protein
MKVGNFFTLAIFHKVPPFFLMKEAVLDSTDIDLADIKNTWYPLMILRSWRSVYMRKHVQIVSAVDIFVCKWGRGWGRS